MPAIRWNVQYWMLKWELDCITRFSFSFRCNNIRNSKVHVALERKWNVCSWNVNILNMWDFVSAFCFHQVYNVGNLHRSVNNVQNVNKSKSFNRSNASNVKFYEEENEFIWTVEGENFDSNIVDWAYAKLNKDEIERERYFIESAATKWYSPGRLLLNRTWTISFVHFPERLWARLPFAVHANHPTRMQTAAKEEKIEKTTLKRIMFLSMLSPMWKFVL